MEIEFTSDDFDRLSHTSCEWTTELYEAGQWEGVDSTSPDHPTEDWQWVYWVGDSWLTVKFAGAWLAQRREAYEVLYDEHSREFAILTNYDSNSGDDQIQEEKK